MFLAFSMASFRPTTQLTTILLFQLSQPFFIHLQDIPIFLSIFLEPRNSMNEHEHYVPIVLRDGTYDNSRLRLLDGTHGFRQDK
jgi:hypothetical protein